MPYKRGTEPCVKEVGEFIYETLTVLGPTYRFLGLHLEHPTRRRFHHIVPAGNLVFQHWCPPRVGQAKPTMARKIAVFARATSKPVARGRPRRNAPSTYTSTLEDQAVEEPAVEDQPSAAKE